MRTPKGWSGPKKVGGEFVEGSFHAHQVPLMAAKTDKGQLADLQRWLLSYQPAKLFTKTGDVVDSIKHILPPDNKKIGQRPETYKCHEVLKVPDWKKFGIEKGSEESCMKAIGRFIDQALVDNPKSLRLFSPDELVSNKLDAVFNHTGRNFQWDEFSSAKGGRVVEILSEHTCQGFLQGYTLTGRTGIFPSYESFLGIIHTMMVQYSKFNKMARETNWRTDISSINYIETSTWTRQEHNGFSHQNPSFIGAVLNLKPAAARVYLPPDAVSNLELHTMFHLLTFSRILSSQRLLTVSARKIM
jgi:xylulose-5-phosphate/fructose-6-phosphate phosphoketolase